MAAARRVWALADTHLGAAVGKSMDRFGDYWHGHREKILVNTRNTVGPEDVFLLPGDLSWAMHRRDAIMDLSFLAALPGIKIAIKGNHDYWWESGRPIGYPGLLSPPVRLGDGGLGIAGTRGWFVPEPGSETEAADRRVLERERERLVRSLEAIADCETRLVMTHYPPQPFLPEIAAAGAAAVAYGHVHLGSLPKDEILAVDGALVGGVPLYCVACDRINFTPRRIL
ncbi:MAG: metallophosphoesterase [Cytophagales bacterium]|nr:metallophosphoesterase [Armatimonadota bacterium]